MKVAIAVLLVGLCLHLSVTEGKHRNLYKAEDPILQLTGDTFNKSIYNQKKNFIVQFYTNWCRDSVRYVPTWVTFAKDVLRWKNFVEVAAVNCAHDDQTESLCDDHDIEYIPTLKYFKYQSKDASDGVFEREENNITKLEAKLTKRVMQDWWRRSRERPQWPSFALHPVSSSTLVDMWKATKASYLAVCLDTDEPDSYYRNLMSAYCGQTVMDWAGVPGVAVVALHRRKTFGPSGLLIYAREEPELLYISDWKQFMKVGAIDCSCDLKLKDSSSNALCGDHQIEYLPTIKFFKYQSEGMSDGAEIEEERPYDDVKKVKTKLSLLVYEDLKSIPNKRTEWPRFAALEDE